MGNNKLRRQVAKWSFSWQGNLSETDIVTTPGCIAAVSYCLMALAKRGDTIAVESPCYFGILQLAQSMGLKILELPAHPQTGIDIDALKKAITKNKIKVCIFCSNFNNPVAVLCRTNKKRSGKGYLRIIHPFNRG
jgi:DNA-binding transcriptional MocR family regulator